MSAITPLAAACAPACLARGESFTYSSLRPQFLASYYLNRQLSSHFTHWIPDHVGISNVQSPAPDLKQIACQSERSHMGNTELGQPGATANQGFSQDPQTSCHAPALVSDRAVT
jgi:hypothetical protein